jgi:membrane protease YdiL (CAAX protease family)
MDNKRQRQLVWVYIFYLFVLPVILLYFNVIHENLRVILLIIVAMLLIGIVRREKWTYEDAGLKKDFLIDFWPYLLFTVGSALFLFWLSKITPHEPMSDWWKNYRFLLLFIPISVLQEVAFRGILMNFMTRAFSNPIFIVSLNALIFAFMHVIYLNTIFVLPFTFIAGIGFAWIYLKYKNLILVSISHTVLNFIAVALGFFIIR